MTDHRPEAIADRALRVAKALSTPNALFISLCFAVALGMFLLFNSKAVLSDDAYTSYMPAALALERGNIGLFREMMTLGIARPPLLPLLIALVHSLLSFLSVQQVAHLISCASSGALLLALYELVRRWLSPAYAAIACALFFASPVFLPYVMFGTPDALFALLALLLTRSVLAHRPIKSVVLFALLSFCRPNSIVFIPGLALFFVYLFRQRYSRRWVAAILLVLVLVARTRYDAWVAPKRTILRAHYTEWSLDLFVSDAAGWTVREHLQPLRFEQYWLFATRLARTAPAHVLRCAFGDAGFRSVLFGLLVSVGFVGGVLLMIRRLLKWRTLIEPELAVVLFLAGVYVLAAIYHWETRYWLIIYLSAFVAGLYLVSQLIERFAGKSPGMKRVVLTSLLVLSCGEIAANANVLSMRFPHREHLAFSDAEWSRPEVEREAERTLRAMLARSPHRPIKVLNCEIFSFELMNLVRLEKFADDFHCVMPLLREKFIPSEIDFVVFNEDTHDQYIGAQKELHDQVQAFQYLGYGDTLFEVVNECR